MRVSALARSVAALALLAASGCVSPLQNLVASQAMTTGRSTFTLRSDGRQPEDVKRVERALGEAAPRLEAAWGGLLAPVTVYVVPDHDELERAVRRFGYDWLRAWARYDDVIFQSPGTWGARQDEVNELVLHELTHCVLFQRAGTPEDWHRRGIPLWFREGMAIWTAKQARLYPSHEDIAGWLARDPGRDVFRDGEALSADFYGPVYGYSLHAFSFFLKRFGDGRVLGLLAEMQGGARFDAAFATATGLTPRQFQRDFENYLKFRAFRGTGRTLRRQVDPGTEADRLRPGGQPAAPGPDGLAPRG